MKTGREMDSLVARAVGWKDWMDEKTPSVRSQSGSATWDYAFEPSTRIEHAWRVVENSEILRAYQLGRFREKWFIADCGYDGWPETVVGEAETAPHAICLAALILCGVEVNDYAHR